MELYFSVDIESDGPIPGRNSMLSIGAAAMTWRKKLIDTYSANLEQLEEAKPDPDTMDWWKKQPEAWEACRKDIRPASIVMPEFVEWVESTCITERDGKQIRYKPVFVGYPAGFDFTFVYWYIRAFANKSPFSFSALDIKSYAMAVLKTEFRNSTKRNFPRSWFSKHPHTHVAVDDAIEQGELFCNILAHNVGDSFERKPSKKR